MISEENPKLPLSYLWKTWKQNKELREKYKFSQYLKEVLKTK